MTQKLAHQTQKAAGIGNGLRTATVAAVSSSGITLNINGADVGPFACLDTIIPQVGEVVSVFRQDSTWVIIGRATLNPSPWTKLTLINGWTGTFAIRLVHSVGKSLQIAASMTPGTKTDGTTVTTLPTWALPLSSWDIPGTASATVSGGQSPHFGLPVPSGNVNCYGFANSGNAGIQVIIPLDL